MPKFTYLILLVLLANANQALPQVKPPDRPATEKFPLVIGNIGFATDSTDIVVGDVPLGEAFTFSMGLFNFGKEPVMFTSGKSNRFVTIMYEPAMLMPQMEGMMNVELNADVELGAGEFETEISIVSNDNKNPYKFLNLLANIMESAQGSQFRELLDTVPHMVFDHYNYDYGHLVRGRILYHTYLISNKGSLPLNIFEIELPKGIKVVDSPPRSILPGESVILRIRINTRGRVGVQHQTVHVHSNDPLNPLITLGIHGSVKIFPSHKKTSVQCDGEQRY